MAPRFGLVSAAKDSAHRGYSRDTYSIARRKVGRLDSSSSEDDGDSLPADVPRSAARPSWELSATRRDAPRIRHESSTANSHEFFLHMDHRAEAFGLVRNMAADIDRMQDALVHVDRSLEAAAAQASGEALNCPLGHAANKQEEHGKRKTCSTCRAEIERHETRWRCQQSCKGFAICQSCYDGHWQQRIALNTKSSLSSTTAAERSQALQALDLSGILVGLEAKLKESILQTAKHGR